MSSITDEFRVYPLPDDVDHHNLIQLNPEGADNRVANYRSYGVASDAYLSELQEQVDSLVRGAKIRATLRGIDSPEVPVFDGDLEHIDEESVYIDYCVPATLPDSLQSAASELTEMNYPRATVLEERVQDSGPGVLVELYPMFGSHDTLWLDILLGERPLEDRLGEIPRVGEPAKDVLMQIPRSGQAFAIYYFAAASHDEMARYRSLMDTPRGSTQEMEDVFEYLTADEAL